MTNEIYKKAGVILRELNNIELKLRRFGEESEDSPVVSYRGFRFSISKAEYIRQTKKESSKMQKRQKELETEFKNL